MKQAVVVTRSADRHEEDHERGFADTWGTSVKAGRLDNVLERALRDMPEMPEGKYTITVSEPYA